MRDQRLLQGFAAFGLVGALLLAATGEANFSEDRQAVRELARAERAIADNDFVAAIRPGAARRADQEPSDAGAVHLPSTTLGQEAASTD